MYRLLIALMSLALAPVIVLAGDADIGNRDQLLLAQPAVNGSTVRVDIQVVNDEELLGMDIPLRFGKPGDGIELVQVEYASRVQSWKIKHALIDNQEKTVMLGLIAGVDSSGNDPKLAASSEKSMTIATLVFKVEGGVVPAITTFTTQRPERSLTYVYNRYQDGIPYVEEFAPSFTPSTSYKLTSANIPIVFELSQNSPNPFNPSTSFTLSLPKASDYSIRIFNITGQIVKSYAGHLEAGVHTVTWDGRNDQGVAVASGVYFYCAEAGEYKETRRMMMLK